jgi:FkbM family methyltransferase
MKKIIGQIGSVFLTLTRFCNPLIILLTRLGLVEIPYFVFRFATANRPTAMLGRPTTTSLADLFVIKEVFIHETYKDILTLLPQNNISFIDIGANLGCFSIWLNQAREISDSHCFEPEPDSFRLLNFNLSLNGCTGVTPIPAAVGGEARRISIQLKSSSPGGTNIYGSDSTRFCNESRRQKINVIAFGEWLKQTKTNFDLLKLDCEGAEWEIVKACGQTIRDRFALVVAEVHDDPENVSSVNEFPKLMSQNGFEARRWDGKSQGLYIGTRAN